MDRRRFLAGATATLCLMPGALNAETKKEDPLMTDPKYAVSVDGTKVAYWSTGEGPTLVIVAGAFNDHNTGAELAAELAKSYTVVTYDRRGRGASGDTPGYAPQKEIDDLAAVVKSNGGSAVALGFSSGGSLVLMAAAGGVPLSKLILVEAPWMLSEARPRPALDLAKRLRSLAEGGKQGEAVELFQRDYIGMPDTIIAQMRHAPFRPFLEEMALTTSYDAEIMGDLTLPEGLLPKVTQPTLLLAGEKSPPWMAETASTIAKALPEGAADVVAGIGHDLTPEIAPYVFEFLE